MLLPSVRRLVKRLARQAVRRSSTVVGRWSSPFRPRLEVLEDRTLPAQVNWINPAGGDWATPTNWSTDTVPGVADDVVINVPNNVTVTHSRGADMVHSLVSNDALVLSGGSLDFAAASTLNSSLTFTNGTLSGRGDFTINGALTWSGGTMTGTGHTVANGGLTLSSMTGATTLDGRQLDNAGSGLWTGPGNIFVRNDAQFNNLAGGSFDVSTDSEFFGVSGTTFNNAGTFRKVDSSGMTVFGTAFNNSGTVDLQTGTLSLEAGSDSTGSFTAEAGTTLVFTTPTTLRPTSSVSGGGTVRILQITGSGTFNVLGAYSVTNTTLFNGTINFARDITVTNLNINGGNLTGLSDVTVTGMLNWTAGNMSGTGRTISTGALNISGTDFKLLDTRTLNNAGAATWMGTNLQVIRRAVFNNLAGATFDAQTDTSLGAGFSDTPGVFNNAGTFTKSLGTGTTSVTIVFNNSGTTEVQTGTLSLGAGTSSGTITADAGATLAFTGGINTLTATSAVNGDGNVQFAGNVNVFGSFAPRGTTTMSNTTVNFGRDVDLPVLIMTSGTLSGTGNVAVEGALTWSGGTMSGPGTTVSKGTLSLITTVFSGQKLDGRTLNNAGTATWRGTGPLELSNGAVINNLAGGSFLVQDNAGLSVSGGAVFNNAGDFRKNASGGTTTLNLVFNNTGSLEAQTGTLNLAASGESTGLMSVSSGAILQFSGTAYTLRSASSVDGAGTVLFGDIFGNAVTNVTGAYTVARTVINSGTVNFASDVSVNQLTLNGGTMTGTANVTVTSVLTWTGGAMTGPGSTNSAGTLSLSGGSSKDLNGRTFNNAGTATWTDTGTLALRNGGVLDNLLGAILLIQNDTALRETGSVGDTPGIILNEGTLRKQASSSTTTISTIFNNSGTVDVRTGTLLLSGPFNNFDTSSRTLTGGTYVVRTALQFGTGIINNRATIVLDGANSRIFTGTSQDALAGLTTNSAAGSFTIANGRNFTFAAAFTNAGSVTISAGGAFNLTGPNGAYAQAAGARLFLDSGTLTAASGVVIRAGSSLAGTGTINALLINEGRLSPGGDGATGLLTINGTYIQTSTGALAMDLGGLSAGSQYNQLRVSSIALLDGGLEVHLTNDFNPVMGNTFQILIFGGHNGNFATETFPSLAEGLFLDPVLDITSLTLITTNVSAPLPLGSSPGSTLAGTVYWINPDGGNWSTASNWSTGRVPGATDDVVIDVPNSVIITHSSGADTIQSLRSENALVLSGGSLNLASASTFNGNFTFSNGTLSGLGDLTVNGPLTWSGGTMTGPGRTIANGGLALSNPGGLLVPSTVLDGRELDNAGSAVWTGSGNITISNGGVFNNLAGATFNAQSSASITGSGSPATFTNAATFLKSASGTTTIGIAFNNSGTVYLQTGTLNLTAVGDSTGSFTAEAGTTLGFVGGATTLRPASNIGGAGSVRIAADFFGNGTVNVLGSYSVSNTILTAASVNFAHDATLTNLNMNGGTLSGLNDVTVTGMLNWTAGTMSGAGRTISTGVLNISEVTGKTLDTRTLNNAGTATWTGTDLAVTHGAVLNNLVGATFDAQANASLNALLVNPPGVFNNAGTFTRSQGTGTSSVNIPFNNSGTAAVRTGTLQLTAGFSSGTFTADAGATLAFSAIGSNVSAIHTLTATSVVNGNGNVQFNGETVYVLGSFAPRGTTMVSNGNVNLDRNVDLPALTFTGGTITGSGNVTVEGALIWTGGTMSGPGATLSNGTLNLGGGPFPGPTLNARTLNNGGTAIWTAFQDFTFGAAAVFNNLAGATFLVQSNATLSSFDPLCTFNNAGDFRKIGSTGTTQINVTFNNSGTVDVETGILILGQSGDDTGSMSVSAGATLQFIGGTRFPGGTHTLEASSSVDGAGTVLFGGPSFSDTVNVNVVGSYTVANTVISSGSTNVSFASDVSLSRLTLNSGTLTGTGSVTVTGVLNWTAGTMSGAGSTTSTGALNFSAGSIKVLDGRALNNAGTATWTGGDFLSLQNGAVLDNQAGATFLIQNNATLTGVLAGTFLNEGTLRKLASSGTTSITAAFKNTGTVDLETGTLSFMRAFVQTGGATVLAAATTLVASADVLLLGGSLSGTGTINANLINSGVVSPGGDGAAGVLTINGSYTQTDTGILRIDLGGSTVGSQYDQLHVSGIATLGGTLEVYLINGFSPAMGNSFQILTFGSHSGDFATQTFPALDDGLFLYAVFDPTSLRLLTSTAM
jgi:hypothetical protein